MRRCRRLFAAALVLLAAIVAACSCSQDTPAVREGGISVRVTDLTDAKTIAPDEGGSITHYSLRLSNDGGVVKENAHIAMAEAAAGVLWQGVIEGSYTVSVTGESLLSDGTYVTIATASQPVSVTMGKTTEVQLVLDRFAPIQSGSVTVDVLLPSSFEGRDVYVLWNLKGGIDGTAQLAPEGNIPISGTVQDGKVTFTLDPAELGDGFVQGVWRLTVQVSERMDMGGDVRTGVEQMRLVAGLEAHGTVDMTGDPQTAERVDLEVVDGIGGTLRPGACTIDLTSGSFVLVFEDGDIDANTDVSIIVDGGTPAEDSWSLVWNGSTFSLVLDGLAEGPHHVSVLFTGEGLYDAGSISMTLTMPKMYTVTFTHDLPSSIGASNYPEMTYERSVVSGRLLPEEVVEPLERGSTISEFVGWVDEETGQPFDFTQPVTEDHSLVGVWSGYFEARNTNTWYCYNARGLESWAEAVKGTPYLDLMVLTDITMPAVADGQSNWEPVMDFEGDVYGMGHSISGLRIIRPDDVYVGFIGKGGEHVQEISFLDAEVVGETGAGIVFGSTNAIVRDVHAQGSVTGGNWVAGIAGHATGSVFSSSFSGELYGGDNVGGIVGYGSGVRIIGCFCPGVTITLEADSGYAGGILGWSVEDDKALVSACWVTGSFVGANGYCGAVLGSVSEDDGPIGQDDGYKGGLITEACWWDMDGIDVPIGTGLGGDRFVQEMNGTCFHVPSFTTSEDEAWDLAVMQMNAALAYRIEVETYSISYMYQKAGTAIGAGEDVRSFLTPYDVDGVTMPVMLVDVPLLELGTPEEERGQHARLIAVDTSTAYGGSFDMDTLLGTIPEKEGKIFTGWYDTINLEQEAVGGPISLTGPVVIYASWVDDTVAVPTFSLGYEDETITISCETPEVEIWYRIDGGEAQQYAAPLSIPRMALYGHEVTAYAQQEGLTTSSEATVSIPVQAVAPEGLSASSPRPATIELTGADGNMEYRIGGDGGTAWERCAQQGRTTFIYVPEDMRQGGMTLEVRRSGDDGSLTFPSSVFSTVLSLGADADGSTFDWVEWKVSISSFDVWDQRDVLTVQRDGLPMVFDSSFFPEDIVRRTKSSVTTASRIGNRYYDMTLVVDGEEYVDNVSYLFAPDVADAQQWYFEDPATGAQMEGGFGMEKVTTALTADPHSAYAVISSAVVSRIDGDVEVTVEITKYKEPTRKETYVFEDITSQWVYPSGYGYPSGLFTADMVDQDPQLFPAVQGDDGYGGQYNVNGRPFEATLTVDGAESRSYFSIIRPVSGENTFHSYMRGDDGSQDPYWTYIYFERSGCPLYISTGSGSLIDWGTSDVDLTITRWTYEEDAL